MPKPLMAHQLGDVDWILPIRRGLLANAPGLGKSRSAITATQQAKTLVIAPAMVIASGVWDDQLAQWAARPELYTQVPYTSLNQRVKTGAGGRASSTKPIDEIRPEFRGPWDAVIIDEAHYIKGRKTTWTGTILELGDRADLVIPMTGTPVPNWSHEVFTMLQLLHPSERRRGRKFGSFWRWAEEWFDTSPTRFSDGNPAVGSMLACTNQCRNLLVGSTCDHYIDFTKKNFGERYRRVEREQVQDLPPITDQTVLTPMTATQRRLYRDMKRYFSFSVDGEAYLAWNQGSKNVALDKLTVSDWMLIPNGEPKGGKLEQLRLDLSQRSRATLVLAHHTDVLEACGRVAGGLGLRYGVVHGKQGTAQAGATIRAFVHGELDVLCGSLEMVAEGHTLTVADMAIFVETSWKTYRNEQAMFRIHRIGQTRPVTIRRYKTPDSVDIRKDGILASKTEDQIRLMTAADFAQLL